MDQIDDLLDLGLTEFQIDDVMQWHQKEIERHKQEWGGVIINRILSFLLHKTHKTNSLRIRALGLAFGTGLGAITGHPSAEAAARSEGCSGMAISKAGKAARISLGLTRESEDTEDDQPLQGPRLEY